MSVCEFNDLSRRGVAVGQRQRAQRVARSPAAASPRAFLPFPPTSSQAGRARQSQPSRGVRACPPRDPSDYGNMPVGWDPRSTCLPLHLQFRLMVCRRSTLRGSTQVERLGLTLRCQQRRDRARVKRLREQTHTGFFVLNSCRPPIVCCGLSGLPGASVPGAEEGRGWAGVNECVSSGGRRPRRVDLRTRSPSAASCIIFQRNKGG